MKPFDDKTFDEYMVDARLHIKTIGRIDHYADDHVYPYEPTTYTVLERIAESGLIGEGDHLLDYGCGKARTLVYLHEKTGCRASGVELIRDFYEEARKNIAAYEKDICRPRGKAVRIDITHGEAQKYKIPPTVNRIIFFNPFYVEIFESVMKQVTGSYYEDSRNIRLFLYYPQDSYVAALSRMDEVMFFDEIDCRDLFPEKDDRNKVMIFELG
ncbi:MAG: SAM-dependent methyltransferase [Lachnospiraceae bacterium]|nr:SAM-dependent methyltransferase [Lachnospiraceae bacterium]